ALQRAADVRQVRPDRLAAAVDAVAGEAARALGVEEDALASGAVALVLAQILLPSLDRRRSPDALLARPFRAHGPLGLLEPFVLLVGASEGAEPQASEPLMGRRLIVGSHPAQRAERVALETLRLEQAEQQLPRLHVGPRRVGKPLDGVEPGRGV